MLLEKEATTAIIKNVPLIITTNDGEDWTLAQSASRDSFFYSYRVPKLGVRCGVHPSKIETEFSKSKRPEPNSKIITQGRWECGAASLAMFIDESLWDVKRALVHSGWNNDDNGVNCKQLVEAALKLGHNLEIRNELSLDPCLLTIKSLNVAGMFHSLCWNGSELLDPNWGNLKRFTYGPEWSPLTLPFLNRSIVKSVSK